MLVPTQRVYVYVYELCRQQMSVPSGMRQTQLNLGYGTWYDGVLGMMLIAPSSAFRMAAHWITVVAPPLLLEDYGSGLVMIEHYVLAW